MTLTSKGMWTFSGQYVDIDCIDPDTVLLRDIARHLANIRRWAGATDLTVGEHSLSLARLAMGLGRSPNDQLRALLHDGSEYLYGDMPRPIAALPIMARYKSFLHAPLQGLIYDKWHVADPYKRDPAWLRDLDSRLCLTEARDLLHPNIYAHLQGLTGLQPIPDVAHYWTNPMRSFKDEVRKLGALL